MKVINWLKKLKRVVDFYDADRVKLIKQLTDRVAAAEALIKDRTDISADVHLHGNNRNQIIVTGRYRNSDYVQIFTLTNDGVSSLIKQLKDMERYGVVDKVDVAPQMRYVFERELKL